MGLSCGMKCLKYLLFVFNFVIWVAGIAILVVGIWSRIKSKDFDTLFGSGGITSAANIMIAAGCCVMVIGFVGCCGAMKQNKCLLVSYFLLLLIIFVLEITAGIIAYTKKDETLDKVKENIAKTVKTDYGGTTESQESLTDAVDYVQKKLDCCGTDGPSDWSASAYFQNRNTTVPQTCCVDGSAACTTKTDYKDASIHQKGCVDATSDWVKDHIAIIGGLGVAIAVIQLLGMVFAICLCRAISNEEM